MVNRPWYHINLHPFICCYFWWQHSQGAKPSRKITSHWACDCQPVGRGETLAALQLRNQMSVTQEQARQMQESASDSGVPLSFSPFALKKHSWASLAVPPIPSAEQCHPCEILPMWDVLPGLYPSGASKEKTINNHLGSAIHPNSINHSEWHWEGRQQVWAGSAQPKPTTGASNPFAVLRGSQ